MVLLGLICVVIFSFVVIVVLFSVFLFFLVINVSVICCAAVGCVLVSKVSVGL